MRVLVTGITGFVGGHLAEHLLTRGDQVTGCSRRGAWPNQLAHLSTRVRLAACDLTNPGSPSSLFDQQSFDIIVHLAGLADPSACRDYPEEARSENTDA